MWPPWEVKMGGVAPRSHLRKGVNVGQKVRQGIIDQPVKRIHGHSG